MFGFGNNKNKAGKAKQPPKHRFEQPQSHEHSQWRKPQGHYTTDIDARKRLRDWLTRLLFGSQILSLILMTIIFFGMGSMILFGNFENVIMDDGSLLFCTILDDGSVGIAF